MAGVVLSAIALAFFTCLILKVARRPKTLRISMFRGFTLQKRGSSVSPTVCVFWCDSVCVRHFNEKHCCPQSIIRKFGLMGMGIGLTPAMNALRSTVLLGRMQSTRERRGQQAPGTLVRW